MNATHAKNRCFVIFFILVVITFGFVNCSENSSTNSSDRDSGGMPLVALRLKSPNYLASNVAPSAKIEFFLLQYDATRLVTDKAFDLIKKEAVIEDYPAQSGISGTWTVDRTTKTLKFAPKSNLTNGDYIIRFPAASADFYVFPKPYNLFRVGPILRLARVSIFRYSDPTKKDDLLIGYSQALATKTSVSFKLEEKTSIGWNNLTINKVSNSTLQPISKINLETKVRLTVDSKDIDGKFSGSPGSGSAIVEFTPKDHLASPGQYEYYVEPDLKVYLPSGQKK
jgi:hypothetical protein